jgi:hypothetical protein
MPCATGCRRTRSASPICWRCHASPTAMPAAVTLLGLVPETIDLSVQRSRVVDSGIDALVAAIVSELESLGYEMVTETETAGRHRPIHDLARHFGM